MPKFSLCRTCSPPGWLRAAAPVFAAALTEALVSPCLATAVIEQGVFSFTDAFYHVVRAVVLPIGAVIFALECFSMFFGGEKGLAVAKKRMFCTIIALIGVWLAPLVCIAFKSWFSGTAGAGGSMFSIVAAP